MANLALCARTAHQGGLVGNTREFRHPECFFRGKRIRRHSFGYFSFAVERKVTRQRGETRNAKLKINRKCYEKEKNKKLRITTRALDKYFYEIIYLLKTTDK